MPRWIGWKNRLLARVLRYVPGLVRPPRALFLRWPFGHPLGEPFAVAQQQRVMRDMFRALESMQEPGSLVEPGYRWRRQRYD